MYETCAERDLVRTILMQDYFLIFPELFLYIYILTYIDTKIQNYSETQKDSVAIRKSQILYACIHWAQLGLDSF